MYAVIKQCIQNNWSVDCQIDMFDSIVKPTLLYGSEVWGYSNLDIIERLHLKYCKYNIECPENNSKCYGLRWVR